MYAKIGCTFKTVTLLFACADAQEVACLANSTFQPVMKLCRGLATGSPIGVRSTAAEFWVSLAVSEVARRREHTRHIEQQKFPHTDVVEGGQLPEVICNVKFLQRGVIGFVVGPQDVVDTACLALLFHAISLTLHRGRRQTYPNHTATALLVLVHG